MRHLSHKLALFCALSLFSLCSLAQFDSALFQATIEVEDHGSRELARASREGLAQVMVKLSGDEAVLQVEPVQESVASSQDLLQQYQYQRAADGSLLAILQYDEALTLDILTRNRQPLWTGERPSVLVWMVVDQSGERRFADGLASQDLREAIREQFATRAIPVKFPLYDLQDTLALDIHSLWQLESLPVMRASQRYGANHVLVARLIPSGDGWLGDWLYLDGQMSETISVYSEDDAAVASEGLELAASNMAERYAVVPTGETGRGMYVQVAGIDQFSDYQSILGLLKGLELVDEAWLAELLGDTALFRLQARVEKDQLEQIIENYPQLQSVTQQTAPGTDSGRVDLAYQWRP